ncbi:protein kinase [Streptomyces diastatochromogenes]|nr:protein kinase [Streptomyces diastatochromogenes]
MSRQMCNRPDCGRGEIDAQGFCDVCDRQPLPQDDAASADRAPEPEPPARGGARSAWRTYARTLVRPRPGRLRSGPAGPGRTAELVGPGRRGPPLLRQPSCGQPVGRGHDGEPGRTTGFCPHCGTRFDFAQPSGLTIAGRYDVARVLGSGAYGAAYLAHDRNLATHVVLKALNKSVAKTARHERDVLVELRHDSIVRILGYEHEGPHLVLEYVPGVPLSARDGDRLETLLAHGVRILQALDYLHARGLLHCDVKPLNIIRFREESPAGALDRVRLIDFGAVRSQTKDTGPVVAYTRAFAPPETDPEHLRPTAGFDLYGLGMTLREVCRSRWTDRSTPGVDSLHLLLDRATDPGRPWRRFVSARQFAEQLSGVIRQVVAAPPTRRQVARPSALFGSMPEALHGGLGAARPSPTGSRRSRTRKRC